MNYLNKNLFGFLFVLLNVLMFMSYITGIRPWSEPQDFSDSDYQYVKLKYYDTANESLQEPQHFEEMKKNNGSIWIFSTFYQKANKATGLEEEIISIGLMNVTTWGENVTVLMYCHVTYKDDTRVNRTETIPGFTRYTWGEQDDHRRKKNVFKVRGHCPLSTKNSRPYSVSFSMEPQSKKTRELTVLFPQVKTRRKLVACHTTLFGAKPDLSRLIQNIEYNRLMGVEHFYIYIMRTGHDNLALLEYYKRQNITTILSMPIEPTKSAYFRSQNMVLDDCHHRARYTSDYIAVLDFDEYLFPLQHQNWNALLAMLESQEKTNKISSPVAHYSFCQSFVCEVEMKPTELEKIRKEIPLSEEDESFIQKFKVDLLKRLYRGQFFPYPQRSKTIYKPNLVHANGVHYPHRIAPGSRRVVVNETVAFLKHFSDHGEKDHDACQFYYDIRAFHRHYLNRLKYFVTSVLVHLDLIDFSATY